VHNAGHPSILVPLLIGALVAWRFYGRIRRMVGRQHLANVRPWITICLFPVLAALVVVGTGGQPLPLLTLAAGAALGIGLGVYGLKLTRFEQTPAGLYYTPSAHLGIALSVLLIARVGYRMLMVYAAQGGGAPPPPPGAYTNSPLTLGIFGAFAGYYVTYAIGLLRWRRSVTATPVAPAANTEG